MDFSSASGIVVAVIAILVLAGLALLAYRYAQRHSKKGRRTRADQLRTGAADREHVIAERETEAVDAERSAEAARREADRLAAGAEHLNAQAAELRAEQQADLAKADRIDPDVADDSDAYVEPGRPAVGPEPVETSEQSSDQSSEPTTQQDPER